MKVEKKIESHFPISVVKCRVNALVAPCFPIAMPESDPSPEQYSANDESAAIMLRVKEGDREAFRELVVRHQHAVVGTVAKMLGGASDAEDIAQMVFLRVWKSSARYKPTAKFTTWLMTITRNLVFNEMRRLKRARAISMNEEPEDGAAREYADAESSDPSDDLLQAEKQAAIDAAIKALPENARIAIILRRYENMPYEEIAKVLKTSVPAVKSLLFRARGELKQKLQQYLE